ncbi:DUF3107 domain-containing protein [Actinomycetaceae bacterium TAE3-ERU4]|nr:DUF3107 domain-containing protein [Actinomycetaceae bacterium TAE3-ERU4]
MNLIIGIQGATRELQLENVEISEDELKQQVAEALSSNTPLVLSESDNRKVMIPPHALGYLELTEDTKRPVGFIGMGGN